MGIDPGVSGGVAVLSPTGAPIFVQGFKGGMTHRELVMVVKVAAETLLLYHGCDVFIEKVGFIKGDGGKGAFTFGQVAGLLRGTILTLGLQVHDVYPFFWQSKMDCCSGGNKNVTKKKALELFAGRGFKITHAVADCMLIAEFGRRSILEKRI